MDSIIPKGWIWTKVQNIADLNMGQSPPSSTYNDEGIGLPFFQGKTEFGKIYPSVRKYCSEPVKIANPNDILISVRAPVGPTNLCKVTSCIGRGLAAIKANSATSTDFLLFFFKKIEPWLSAQGSGSTFTAINKDILNDIDFPLPPLAEQRRIVVKLDAAIQRVEASQARLEKLPGLLKQFRQAVLAAAVSGRLTEAWRANNPVQETGAALLDEIIAGRKTRFLEACAEAEALGKKKPRKVFLEELPEVDTTLLPKLPSDWTATTVGFLAHVTKLAGFEYTNHIRYQDQGDIPVVRAQNVQMGHFSEENLVYIDLATSNYLERSQLHGREVLMVFIGAGTGNVCLAPKNRRWHLAPNVAKIDCDIMLPEYLNYYLQSPVGLRNTLSFVKATAQPSLSMETIREVAVVVPNLAEQQEIVRQINHYFNLAAQLETRYEQAAAVVEQLPQALLAKAFSGQLVPQDPNDEPANVLLERLKAATKVASEKGKQKGEIKTAKTANTKQSIRKMKGKPVKTLPEFVERLSQLGGKAQPKQLLIEFDLQEDIDSFFELLREGKDQGLIHVPTGEIGQIELV